MSKILISGVPGTGKSTIANYIETNHDYFHVDMEQDDFAPRHEFEQNSDKFLGKLAAHSNILISWGFGPFQDRKSIEYIRDNGYSIIWLDGNRVASFREFMKREQDNLIKEAAYYGQMQMVVVTGIVEALKPININPFGEDGYFRAVDEIARDVLNVAA